MNARAWVAAGAALVVTACDRTDATAVVQRTGGDPARGAEVISRAGCGSCHTIPGIRHANGRVGPPLLFFSERTFIAGRLPNTPENLVAWIQDPTRLEPRTAMPALGLGEQQARDAAAYLYTLK